MSGCKSAPPPAPAAPAPVILPAAKMTDEQLVRAQQADGLGLGLRLDASSYRTGVQIPMHILMEDLAATVPIASGMCSGFTLTYEDTTSHVGRTEKIDNPRCFSSVPPPDEIPLVKGKVKSVEISQRNASNMDIPVGTYLLSVNWKAIPAGKATIIAPPAYTSVQSNSVVVTVTP